VYLITHKIYAFSLDKAFIQIISVQLLIAIGCFLIVKLIIAPYSYLIGSVFVVASIVFSLYELNKRLDLKHILIVYKEK
jgi:hypothetical protein